MWFRVVRERNGVRVLGCYVRDTIDQKSSDTRKDEHWRHIWSPTIPSKQSGGSRERPAFLGGNVNKNELLEEAIKQGLRIRFEKLGMELSAQMMDMFQHQAKQIVAETVLDVFRCVNFDNFGQTLTITVKLPEGKK
jgi:hypothetical protein